MEPHEYLFPYNSVRPIQENFVGDVLKAVYNGRCLVAHAPTGLGKTAATIAPALSYALKNNKTVFFLTSRHTQHAIALETLQHVSRKYDTKLNVVDVIGKKWMCLKPGAQLLRSGEFTEFCKKAREDGQCEYYKKTRKGAQPSDAAIVVIEAIKRKKLMSVDQILNISEQNGMCPYELAMIRSKDAHIVIADYNYIFNERIRENFFARIGKTLEDSIVIVDEGHNLPSRLRDLLTTRLTSNVIKSAIREAKNNGFGEMVGFLSDLQGVLVNLAEGVKDQKLVSRDEFIEGIRTIMEYDELSAKFAFAGDSIREKNRQSFIGSIGQFLESWLEDGIGYLRFIEVQRKGDFYTTILHHKCMDPSLVSRKVIDNAHSTILMSGTLTPTSMYHDLLGFQEDRTKSQRYKSPFPQENRLNLVIPKTTTKYAARSENQFQNIAQICADIANRVPGNTAFFFPSYKLRNDVYKYFNTKCKKTSFLETPGLTTEEKHELLENFKKYHKIGAVLLGVAAGSFGEGIDLPGDYLKCVVVVGLPLAQPSLETKELIKYYDTKYRRGWDYGYTFPALNKVMQAAGRCIRSGTDRGAIVFLDERYAWENYYRCFPVDWDVTVSRNYMEEIDSFYNSNP